MRLKLHVETACRIEQLLQKPRHRHVAGAQAEYRLADRAQCLREGLDIVDRWHKPGIEVHLRHFAVIASEKSAQRLRQKPAHGEIEPSHDAEIDRMDPSFGINEKISGMKVGMKKTIPQRLYEKALQNDNR